VFFSIHPGIIRNRQQKYPDCLTDLIIMDFAKAFDKVPHRRLLYKLNYYGISGHTLYWISAFLTNRTETVVIDGKSSSTVDSTEHLSG
jgi:hypothetical protein